MEKKLIENFLVALWFAFVVVTTAICAIDGGVMGAIRGFLGSVFWTLVGFLALVVLFAIAIIIGVIYRTAKGDDK